MRQLKNIKDEKFLLFDNFPLKHTFCHKNNAGLTVGSVEVQCNKKGIYIFRNSRLLYLPLITGLKNQQSLTFV